MKLENRYEGDLRDANQAIIELIPADLTLRVVTALEFKRLYKDGARALEIGCGEGDSVLPILERTDANIDALDESPEMISIAKQVLSKFGDRVTFITKDAGEYLETCEPYDIITSSWTFHNFKKDIREQLFKLIFNKLKPGGTFIYMDKVYASGDKRTPFDVQNARHRRYLSPELAKSVADHDEQDFSDTYRIDEEYLVPFLTSIGFKVEIVDRVERDIVLVAQK